MPGSPTIKGDNTVLFGSGGLYATGIIESGTLRKIAEVVLVPDNNGYDVSKIYFNERKEADINVIVQTAAPDLDTGDEVTVKTEAGFLVDETTETWAQKNVRKFNFKATKHMGMTLA
ncbi:hypothetical protein ASA1KI_21260 [Opitutales bacterium ASA1]|uniref:hypothetical protein n=1 Tax=Congregicoccus parvus TaxID=3081749 RepID=UPI002B308DA9|nr:hypothetical protein ASA1KI_21260 [Opitutales bacterium ASA1]